MSELPLSIKTQSPAPPGFEYNDDLLLDYDEQVESAIKDYEYQRSPISSFENVAVADVLPRFNPTNIALEDIYVRDRVPDSMRPHAAPHSEFNDDAASVEMWRIVDRSRLVDGTGLVSSRILLDGTVGDIEKFNAIKHLSSHHDSRVSSSELATPFVSFSTDPQNLAKDIILKHGFGIKDGRDSVVVRVRVDPSRVITGGRNKTAEVLLLGGVAPEEYEAAYEVSDFVENLISEDKHVNVAPGMELRRSRALDYWLGSQITHSYVDRMAAGGRD
jgi:hypothetical protein